MPEEPAGFAEFWTQVYDAAMQVDVDPEVSVLGDHAGFTLSTVRFTSLGGVRIGGWLAVPAERAPTNLVVIGHGYGGRGAPDLDLVPEGAAAFFPVARGLPEASRVDGIPAVAAEHVLHGIESADTYVHGGCAADVWCAASVLIALVPGVHDRLGYVGSSFGGGIGALALPWDRRFTVAALHVPSFGNHDLRLTMPCAGSGEAVRGYVAAHPAAREVLRYFDAAVAARRITVPTVVAPALRDPAVPPPGQFAVYNAIEAPKHLVVLSAGHAEYPEQDDEYDAYLSALRALLAV